MSYSTVRVAYSVSRVAKQTYAINEHSYSLVVKLLHTFGFDELFYICYVFVIICLRSPVFRGSLFQPGSQPFSLLFSVLSFADEKSAKVGFVQLLLCSDW